MNISSTITVASYNMRKAIGTDRRRDPQRVLDVLREIGADVVARAAPDGYTIILTDPALVTNPTLVPTTPYDLGKLAETSVWMARQLGRPSPSRTVQALAG